MKKESIDLGEYEVSKWLCDTGWPTMVTDIDEMIHIYHEWQKTINMNRQGDAYREDILIQMISARMRHIHPDPRDASVITAMLILHATYLAKAEGVPSPDLIKRIH